MVSSYAQRQEHSAPTTWSDSQIPRERAKTIMACNKEACVKLLSFDIEIANVFDLRPGEDLEQYAPFDISVAATAIDGGEERLWYSSDDAGRPLVAMTRDKTCELLRYLKKMQTKGYTVCAWNGLHFDLRWIAYVAQERELAAEIARNCCDPMFQFFNQRGFPVSLEAVARGMGIKQGKLMQAADAPRQWCAGNHQAVMDYVLQDCRLTNLIIRRIAAGKEILWITKSGELRQEPMVALKTVAAVLQDPEPDQTWMTNPLPRRRFHQWLHNQK